jgi:hypothetical protein
MGDGVAPGAQADQPPKRLHPGRCVMDPAFVCFQRPSGGWVRDCLIQVDRFRPPTDASEQVDLQRCVDAA